MQDVELQEVNKVNESGGELVNEGIELVEGLDVNLFIRIGQTSMSVKELYAMKDGEVLQLDSLTTDPVDILLDDKVVMQGELVVVDDNYGVKITNINQQ